MAIPSYTNLKLKIPGPTGIITMEAKMQRALDYEQNSLELATAAIATAKLRELSLRLSMASCSPVMPLAFGAFKGDEDSKTAQIDTRDPAKTM
jgi:hypothetical protein